MKDTPLARHVEYKTYLRERERRALAIERGFRSRLAEAMDVQNAFVTQVLNGSAHLSAEQGLAAAVYLGLDEPNQEYLLNLIQLARAGTPALRRHLQKRLATLRAELLDLKRNVAATGTLGEDEQAVYYGSWTYAAVHVLTTIPAYQTAAAIGPALGLKDAEVKAVLRFLMDAGLIASRQGRLRPTLTQLHLERGSRYLRQHHAQWRLKAIDQIGRDQPEAVHYTTVSSLSDAAQVELKSRMVTLIAEYTEVVEASKEEVLCAFSLDFYRLS